jgi:hypothetical protein
LKVLPKDFTGQQVHETMEGWAGSLGVHCDTCHAPDPAGPGPNGRVRLKFDDDSKPEKQMARIMYTMTEDIKKNYVSKVAAMDKMDTPAAPLTCGTCHRGHLDPQGRRPWRTTDASDAALSLLLYFPVNAATVPENRTVAVVF